MALLTPQQAAAIARGVYRLRDENVDAVQGRGQSLGCEGLFSPAPDSRFEAQSGAIFWKKLTGFGYVAQGEGAFAGDLLIATRGTQTRTDWLANLNGAMQLGPSGLPVHAGFNEVWKSFAPQLRLLLRGRNPARIHCVGHSLGGALATLNADLLTAGHVADVVLYSFGAPRTGSIVFAKSLSQRLAQQQVHRVWHPADPVPMIPLFPYWHLPMGPGGLGVASTSNALVSIHAHHMGTSYEPGVQGASWDAPVPSGAPADEGQRVQRWLTHAGAGQPGVAFGSATLLAMIGRALRWLLAAAGQLVMGAVGLALTAGATLLDQLAWLLGQAALMSKGMAVQLKALIGAIFRFLGRPLVGAADVTTAFLRWVLALLYESLRSVALRAMQTAC